MPLETTIGSGQTVASFSNGLTVTFNHPASKNYIVSIKESDGASVSALHTVHLWTTEAAKQLGATKDYYYCLFKVKYLMPEMVRNENKQAMKHRPLIMDAWKHLSNDYKYLGCGSLIRWTWATKDEYRKAMDEFTLWAFTEAKIQLTNTDLKK